MNQRSIFTQTPVFLVGAERSGTTVLRLMLDHHPKISWCNEFEYAVDQVIENGQCPALDDYYEWLKTHRIFQATNFSIDSDLTYVQLIESFLQQKKEASGKEIVGATVHRHFDRLLYFWPHAKFIHLIRDGRDVARSCIGMGWAGNVWVGIERWIEAEVLWDKVYEHVPEDSIIEITYEALISNPKEILASICEFIGVQYSDSMLTYDEDTTYDIPDSKYIQQWKKKLSDYEIQLVESRIRDLLLERGYQLSGLPSINVSFLTVKYLALQSWLERVKFRISRQGFGLFLSSYIARKIGSKQWKDSVQLKINAIDTQYLK